jgi:tRNA-Thr(GGU) m(6)t(6)A37 methyltransferase TsaA
MSNTNFSVTPIGVLESVIKRVEDAPLFYTEGAPNAWLEIYPAYTDALHRMKAGDELIIITWFHLSDRKILGVHPRGNPANPLTGVFLTRSPDRPNPLGLHRVKLLEIKGNRLHIGPIEAIDGTPVVDIKPVVGTGDE